jgi:hypothetical protein
MYNDLQEGNFHISFTKIYTGLLVFKYQEGESDEERDELDQHSFYTFFFLKQCA